MGPHLPALSHWGPSFQQMYLGTYSDCSDGIYWYCYSLPRSQCCTGWCTLELPLCIVFIPVPSQILLLGGSKGGQVGTAERLYGPSHKAHDSDLHEPRLELRGPRCSGLCTLSFQRHLFASPDTYMWVFCGGGVDQRIRY